MAQRERDPKGARHRRTNFLLGLATGVLAAIVAVELLPRQEDPVLEHFREVRDFVRESFVREVSDEELLDHALHGMLAGLDRYSRYYDREEAASLDRETVGRYAGVGIVFRRPIAEAQVLFPLPGSPADQAGVRVGDRFLELDGRPVAGMEEGELRARLSATDAQRVRARVLGLDGAERGLELHPAEVVDPSIRHVRMLDQERGIGYLAVLSFSRETPAEFDRAFDFLRQRGMRALVLDLRRNYGGVLTSAVAVARRFVTPVRGEDVLVSTEGRGEPVLYRADASEAWYAGFPLAVLVDGDSASASEVLAGALQDHRAAVVTGTPTFGKGMVQTIRRFEEEGTVAKVTSSYYYSPTHRNFERSAEPGREHGILPDVAIPVPSSERERVHAFLAGYGAPIESLPALEAWQAESGEVLVPEPPPDAQLAAAVALFEGRRPGPNDLGDLGDLGDRAALGAAAR